MQKREVYGCIQETHAICQTRWMHQGTTCTAALPPPPASAAKQPKSPQAASKVGRGKMHLKDIWSVINPPGRASAAVAPAPRPTRSVDYWIRTPDWKRKMNDGSLT